MSRQSAAGRWSVLDTPQRELVGRVAELGIECDGHFHGDTKMRTGRHPEHGRVLLKIGSTGPRQHTVTDLRAGGEIPGRGRLTSWTCGLTETRRARPATRNSGQTCHAKMRHRLTGPPHGQPHSSDSSQTPPYVQWPSAFAVTTDSPGSAVSSAHRVSCDIVSLCE